MRADVTAEAETVHVRVWQDGVEALDRAFRAPRRREVDLLAEAIESGRRDPVAVEALRSAALVVGATGIPRPSGPRGAAGASGSAPTDDPRVPSPAGGFGAPLPGRTAASVRHDGGADGPGDDEPDVNAAGAVGGSAAV